MQKYTQDSYTTLGD